MNLRIASIFGYILMVLALVALLLLNSFFADSVLTIVLQIAGLALMIWARITFGRRSFHLAANPTAGGLVTSGPYSMIRHPIYSSILLIVLAGVVSRLSLLTLILTALLIAGIVLRVYAEETLLIREYPEYKIYAAKTKRIIPFIL